MSATLKGLKEKRGEIREEIKAKSQRQLALLDEKKALKPDDDATKIEQFSTWLSQLKGEIEGLEAKDEELGTEIEIATKAAAYTAVDGITSPDTTTEPDTGTKPSDVVTALTKSVSKYSLRTGAKGLSRAMTLEDVVRRPQKGQKPEQAPAIPAALYASPQYENLWRGYILHCNDASGKPDSFERFFKDNASKYAVDNVLSGVSIAPGASLPALLPMRLNELLDCECPRDHWFRDEARVIEVTDSCSLEIYQKVKRTSSFAWGNVCKDICPEEDSEVPTNAGKCLTPQPWTQIDRHCRAKLRCSQYDPIALMVAELAVDRGDELEFAFFYGNAAMQPQGILTDPNVSSYDIPAEECEGENFIDAKVTFLNFWKSIPSRCRMDMNACWILTDWAFCQLLDVSGSGNGCCQRGLCITADDQGNYYLSAPGVPRRKVRIISSELSDQLDPTSPGTQCPFAYGNLSQYFIADFSIGTTLETDTNICTDKQTWALRGYTDGMLACPNKFWKAKFPAGSGKSTKKS